MWELLDKSNSHAVHNQSFLALSIVFVWLSVPLSRYLGIPASLLFLWTCLSGLRIACFGVSPHAFDLSRFFLFSIGAIRDVLTVVAMALFTVTSSSRVKDRVLTVIMFLAIADSVLLLLGISGFWYNPAMDASFIACTLPLFLRLERKWKLTTLLPLAAIVKSGSSTGFLAVAVSALALPKSWKIRFAVTGASLCALPFLPLNHGLFQTSGRIDLWTKVLSFWKEHDWFWSGAGTGTYSQWDEYQRFMPQRWIWLHNEYGQVLFEQGAVGLALFLLVIGTTLFRLRKSWALPSAVTLSFCMLTQPMLRNVVGVMFAALLTAYSRRSYG